MAAKLYDKFDVVVSQPSHSWLTGVANLFTKEFFEIVSSNLSENGIYSQWLNLYNMDQKVLRSILKTFYTVFPHGHVFTDIGDEELIMLGSNKPLEIDMERLRALTKDPALQKKLTQLHFDSAEAFLTNFAVSREQLWPKIQGAQINTDINVFAEANQSNLFYSTGKKESPAEYLVEQFTGDYSAAVKGTLDAEATYDLAHEMYNAGKVEKLKVLLSRAEISRTENSQSEKLGAQSVLAKDCLLYTSPSPRDQRGSRMPSSA